VARVRCGELSATIAAQPAFGPSSQGWMNTHHGDRQQRGRLVPYQPRLLQGSGPVHPLLARYLQDLWAKVLHKPADKYAQISQALAQIIAEGANQLIQGYLEGAITKAPLSRLQARSPGQQVSRHRLQRALPSRRGETAQSERVSTEPPYQLLPTGERLLPGRGLVERLPQFCRGVVRQNPHLILLNPGQPARARRKLDAIRNQAEGAPALSGDAVRRLIPGEQGWLIKGL